MSLELSEGQQAELKQLLDSPLLQAAIDWALADSWKAKAGESTLETAAMAYAYQQGTTDLVAKLYSLVKAKKVITANPTKLKHNTHRP